MLEQQAVPPTLHFTRLNPHIDLGRADIRVPAHLLPLPLRHVGVSSFGFSGTNAHVVLEAAPPPATPPPPPATPPRLIISARTRTALAELVRRYQDHLAATTDSFADICHTAATGRARLAWWVAADSPAALATAEPSNAPPPPPPPTSGRKVALPVYAFDHERFWIDASTRPAAPPPLTPEPDHHPLLGAPLPLPLATERRWDAAITPASPALRFLAGHEVDGRKLLPAACFVEMALAACPGSDLVDLDLRTPFVLAETPRHLHTIAAADGNIRILGHDREGQGAVPPVLHASLRAVAATPAPAPVVPALIDATPLATDAFYAAMQARGVRHGPDFRLLSAITRGDGHARARLAPAPDNGAARHFRVHPARLDAAFTLVAAALAGTDHTTLVPARIARIGLHHPPAADATVTATATRTGAEVRADITIADAEGVALTVEGLLFRPAAAPPAAAQGFYRLAWQDLPAAAPPQTAGFLPAPDRLAPILADASARLAAQHGMARYAAAEAALERAATHYAIAALRRLGLDFAPGAVFTFATTAERLGIAERHHRLLRRLFGLLTEDGILATRRPPLAGPCRARRRRPRCRHRRPARRKPWHVRRACRAAPLRRRARRGADRRRRAARPAVPAGRSPVPAPFTKPRPMRAR